MKILIATIFLCSLFYRAISQTNVKTYKITGEITDLPDGTKFYMVRNNQGSADTVSTKESTNGKFVFEGVLNSEGEPHFIKMDTTNLKITNGDKSYITLFLDNSQIKFSGSRQQWPSVKIDGSVPTIQYQEFLRMDQKQKVELKNDKSLTDDQRKTKYYQFLYNYAVSHKTSYISPYCIYNVSSALSLEFVTAVYDTLTNTIKNSLYGKRLHDRIFTLKNKSELAVGKIIPKFFIETFDSQRKSILEIAQYSKYTLIDFWAWWCAPCRSDIPNMKKVYAAFHNKGFNILSISTDSDLIKWKKAISEDSTAWLHGMEVDNASTIIFGIESIPAYILINHNGEIVSIDCGISGFESERIESLKKYKLTDPNGKAVIATLKEENARGLRENLYEVIESLIHKDSAESR